MDPQENCYFHGKISREEAEKLLMQHGTSGVFLVRESNTAAGDYVLSVLHEGTVVHYQIQRHQNDAYFSIDERSTIHGLDQLIDFYRHNQGGLATPLRQIIICQPPPADDLLNGRTNLLHRVCQQGDLNVLVPMLRDHSKNVEAKNQDGQTAAHIACIYEREAVLAKLIELRRININCRDKVGNSPLHYACRHTSANMVKLLIDHGADVQARNTASGIVPMHEAAKSGNLTAIKLLLAAKSPYMPRTTSGEFPLDFAKEYRHPAIVQFLESYVPPPVHTKRTEWFHGTLSRDEAYSKLRTEVTRLETESGLIDNQISPFDTGVYLVRVSDKHHKIKKFVVSMLEEGKPRHFEIVTSGNFYYIDEGPFMPSLEHLVEHYQNFTDGLPSPLIYPVRPPVVPDAPPVIDFNTIRKSRQHSLPNNPSSFNSITSMTAASPPVPPLPNKMPLNNNTLNNNASNASEKPVKQQKPSPIKAIITDGFRSFRRKTSSSNNNNNNSSSSNKSNDIKLEIASSPLTNLSFTSDFHLDQIYKAPREPQVDINSNSTIDDYLAEDSKIIRKPTIIPDSVKYANLPNNIIPREKLNILEGIGQGEFGAVYKGIYYHHKGPIEVAIKKLPDNHSPEDHSNFIREAQYMMDLYHPCVVRLIGICLEQQVMMIQELVPLGSMLDYIIKNSDNFTDLELKCLAIEIATGMDYLVSKRFVHRDLAARNVLLQSRVKAKLSDFGLSRVFKRDENYYEAHEGGKWPIKWYAPEAFSYGKFSHASDVWSFGILLWEMFTRGQVPYGDETTGAEVIQMIDNGERLEKPEHCPYEIYQIMLACWQYDPKMRPTFSFLTQFFKQLNVETPNEVEYFSISDLETQIKETSLDMIENNNPSIEMNTAPVVNLESEISIPSAQPIHDFVVNRNEVEKGRESGKDEFGTLFEGIYRPSNGTKLQVTIKMVNDLTNRQSYSQFLSEFSLLMKINHPFIVKLIGVVVEQPQMILQEYCPQGSLYDYIRLYRSTITPDVEIRLWAYQIAAGMNYLVSRKVIHRNLATRNVQIQNRQQIKIANFGLAKLLHNDQDMYVSRQTVKFPSKWYAPESIKNREFSSYSDVFSYGVLLWEIYSYGAEPWGHNVSGEGALEMILGGRHLPMPSRCPEEVYGQLIACWSIDPHERPTFNTLMNFFDKLNRMEVEDEDFLYVRDIAEVVAVPDTNANDVKSQVPNDRTIERSEITLKDKLGQGEFGMVWSGEWKSKNGAVTKIAVKTLKSDKAQTYRDAFLQEFALMMKLDHLHIVKLLGIVTSPSLMIVQELLVEGPLINYIKKHRETIVPDIEMKLWAFQIASGMNYLVSKHFVHRDLAARNILLLSKDICKISDFGLSRASQGDYYQAKDSGLWPLKWYAPESFTYGEFSHASDVWSYGVLLYEIYSYGEQPYGSKTNQQVIEFITDGHRLEKPITCCSYIYQKMRQCWEEDKKKRPKFSELMEFFSQETLYENIPNTVMKNRSQNMAIINQRESSSLTNSPINSFRETFVIRI
uniref:non-specific protein-tyrosine kinase n=1 Tax=Culicoides sonorensis TaxID=179676 RepID=A0A336M750_CULSO